MRQIRSVEDIGQSLADEEEGGGVKTTGSFGSHESQSQEAHALCCGVGGFPQLLGD